RARPPGAAARPGRDRGPRRRPRGGRRHLLPVLHRLMSRYPLVVVGAGHAGCQAACIAAAMGAEVAPVTMSLDAIAQMSCNPAIGGLAKGHLVREIDVLGGIMARSADRDGLQFTQ